MSSPIPPKKPGGVPTKPLSRHENMFRATRNGSPLHSPPSKRLSMGGQRLNSPKADGEAAVSVNTGNSRRVLPQPPTSTSPVRKTRSEADTRSLLRRKIDISSPKVSPKQETQHSPQRPLATTISRPKPNTRSPSNSRRSSRSASVAVNAVERPETPPSQRPAEALSRMNSTGNYRPAKPTKPTKLKPVTPSKSSPLVPAKPSATGPPKVPPKPLVLSEEEHNQINEGCKKFCNANKQLLAVSRSTLQKVRATLDPVKVEFLAAQLGVAAEDLKAFNTKFSDFIREAAKALDQKKTCNIACLTVDIANYSSIICAALKLAAVECEFDDSVFKQSLKAITTVKDSLIYVVDILKAVGDKVDPSLIPQLEDHIKKTSVTLAGLVGHKTTGPLIPVGTRMEIEAAIRATVISIAKLVNSFNGPLEQTILTEAKVASCCVAQMWATLNETINTNTNLLSMPEIREIIIGYASDIKQAFAVFMEATKCQVANPCPSAFTAMKENERPLRELLHTIVSHIQAYSIIDTTQRVDIDVKSIKPTDAHIKFADSIVCDPADIVPPPPTNITQSVLDVPDDFVPSAPQIWDEPATDEGRVLYTDSGNLRCATLNKLIIHTTANLDMNRMKTFITTYRSFTTPEILLEKIIQRYHVPPDADVEPLPIQLRCCNSLKYLIETQYEDFSEEFVKQLDDFLVELQSATAYKKFATIIKTTLKKKQEERQTTKTEIVNLTIEEKIPLSPGKFLTVINEEQIALQLTLVDFRIYKAIKPIELLNQAWSKAKYRYRAKNVLALVARSTALTMWVASVILWQNTLRERVRAYTKMVNIAQHMLQLNNFNSLMAILAGINTSAIYRLKHTREQIPAATKQTLEDLSDLMDPTQSYGNYRQKLHDVDPPCVPFLGTYLTDITFIEDGNPDWIQGLINYRKRELVFSVIREIQQYQQQSYTDDFVNISHFLTELASNDEEKLYELSLIREPRGATLDQLL